MNFDSATLATIAPRDLLPHRGRMCLVERVIACDEAHIVCETDSHRAPDHPLALDGVLAAVCGLEYGAQAMAIHGALLAARGARPSVRSRVGYIVAAHELSWSVARLDDLPAPLVIEARREFGSDNQVSYAFVVRAGGRDVMQGRAGVVLSAA
jgi:predicted hotdog family 3-hydroxylacyl-ACP dehydratase